MTSSQVPSGAAVAAETALPSRRRRPLSLRSIARASVPYWLLLPVVVVIGAILGYPLYHLVKLSFEQYGLFELIRREGEWIGLDNFSLRPPLGRLLGHARADGRVHRRHRWLDHRPRDADRAAARAGQPDRPRRPHGRPRSRLGDAGRRRGSGLVLDDELPERRAQSRARHARARRLLGARLVRDDVLEARDGGDPDPLGGDPLHHDHRLRRPGPGAGGARGRGRDRRRGHPARCSAT